MRIAREFGREVADRQGGARDLPDRRALRQRRRDAGASIGYAPEPQAGPARLHLPRLNHGTTRPARRPGFPVARPTASPASDVRRRNVSPLSRHAETTSTPNIGRHLDIDRPATAHAVDAAPAVSRKVFPWVVFVLTFGLLLSDYMSRQVLSAVFPLLKADWGLTDTQLGSLSSVVALTVGMLTVPLSVLGDRWGRVRGHRADGGAVEPRHARLRARRQLRRNAGRARVRRARRGGLRQRRHGRHPRMFPAATCGPRSPARSWPAARSARCSAWPRRHPRRPHWAGAGRSPRWRLRPRARRVLPRSSSTTPAWLATATPDGVVATTTTATSTSTSTTAAPRARLRTLFSTPAVICAYIGSGLQLAVAGALFAWLPSHLNRDYGLSTATAATYAAVFILLIGVGMIYCGALTDRIARRNPLRKWTSAWSTPRCRSYSSASAFQFHTGWQQVLLLGVGAFFAGATAGPAGAMVANLTPRVDPRHRARNAHPREQPARPRRRSVHRRHPGRPVRPGRPRSRCCRWSPSR